MRKLALVCVAALAIRLGLLLFVDFPGIADPNHYFNLGLRLVEGHGFTLDYIWQYNLPPVSIEHPIEHWMPGAAVLAAGAMALLGESVKAALLPFVLLGALLPVLSYAWARRLRLGQDASLFSAAAVAALPELMIYSLRTDTVIPFSICIGGSLLLLQRGFERGESWPFAACGIGVGLAYLTRSDALLLLPTTLVSAAIYPRWGRVRSEGVWARAALLVLAALVVVSPWLIRNLQTFGVLATPELDDMFFFTSHDDHYAYGRDFTLGSMMEAQTLGQIVGKRLFELAAAVKVMIQSLGVLLPVAVAGGVLLLVAERDHRRMLTLAPIAILLAGLLVSYPLLLPYKSQAGSFKKAFVSTLPLVVPVGAYAIERAVTERRFRWATMALVVALAGANAVDAIRLEQAASAEYLSEVRAMAAEAVRLPDMTGDDQLVLMAQDPFILRYVGLRSVMFPSESRDGIIDIAEKYHVDYLLMPADREALDPLLIDETLDPRFTPVADVPGTPFRFFGITRLDAE